MKTRLISNLYHCTVFFYFYQGGWGKKVYVLGDLVTIQAHKSI
jgi:hypothetical protein